jgi:hypothetical protein
MFFGHAFFEKCDLGLFGHFGRSWAQKKWATEAKNRAFCRKIVLMARALLHVPFMGFL